MWAKRRLEPVPIEEMGEEPIEELGESFLSTALAMVMYPLEIDWNDPHVAFLERKLTAVSEGRVNLKFRKRGQGRQRAPECDQHACGEQAEDGPVEASTCATGLRIHGCECAIGGPRVCQVGPADARAPAGDQLERRAGHPDGEAVHLALRPQDVQGAWATRAFQGGWRLGEMRRLGEMASAAGARGVGLRSTAVLGATQAARAQQR